MPKFSGDFPKIPKYLIFHKLSNESLFCTEWVSVRTNTVTKKFNWDFPEQRTFISVASTLHQFKLCNRFTRFLQGSLILLQRASELMLHAATRQRKYKRPQDCLRIVVFLTEWELKTNSSNCQFGSLWIWVPQPSPKRFPNCTVLTLSILNIYTIP